MPTSDKQELMRSLPQIFTHGRVIGHYQLSFHLLVDTRVQDMLLPEEIS